MVEFIENRINFEILQLRFDSYNNQIWKENNLPYNLKIIIKQFSNCHKCFNYCMQSNKKELAALTPTIVKPAVISVCLSEFLTLTAVRIYNI